MGAKKIGRPKIDNPRTESLGIRISTEEKARLDYICKIKDCSRRDFIMNCVDKEIKKIKE